MSTTEERPRRVFHGPPGIASSTLFIGRRTHGDFRSKDPVGLRPLEHRERLGPRTPRRRWNGTLPGGVLSSMPTAGDEKKPGPKKADYSFAMMVPGAGLEPALPLPGKGF